ncbi:MAG: hypothetical protein AAGF11_36300 [Myxococcota bacterium]
MHRNSLGIVALGMSLGGCFLFGGSKSTAPTSQPGAPATPYRAPEFDQTREQLQAVIAEKTTGFEEVVSAQGVLEAYTPSVFPAKRGECHVVVIELLEGAAWSDHAMQMVSAEGKRPGEEYTIGHASIVHGPGVVVDNGCVQVDGQVSIDVIATFGSATDKSRIHELGTGPIRSSLYVKTVSEQEIAAMEAKRAAAWEQAEIDAEQFRQEEEARRRQAEADRQAREAERAAAQSSGSGRSSGAGGASGGPSVVSVQLKNNCPSTVKLFFGTKPKFGSGRYSSLSSNTRRSESMKPGDMVWIVDDSQNGISSATVSASTREIEVTRSCTGLSAR